MPAEDALDVLHCVNHANVETLLRCGKCDNPICTRCAVPTPVGYRCRTCAQLRRLPQYEVSLRVVGPALLAGLGISAAGWYLLTFIPFLSFFAAIFIGMAIGGAVSRVAKRRTNVYLEVGAVVDVVLGWMVAETVRSGGEMNWLLSSGRYSSIYVAIPLLFASYFAYTRVR